MEVPVDMFEGCVFDVAATGESGFAAAAANLIRDRAEDEAERRLREQLRRCSRRIVTRERVSARLDAIGSRSVRPAFFTLDANVGQGAPIVECSGLQIGHGQRFAQAVLDCEVSFVA